MLVWEESNYWETGYNFKLVHNTTDDQVMVLCHSHLDFKNGLIIPPGSDAEGYRVSRSQYAFSVPPQTKRGVFAKPYTGFGRGGQAHTPYVVDVSKYDSNILNYYESHYNRYQLKSHNVVPLEEEAEDDSKLPDDHQEVEDEGTAPAVKSGYRPGPKRELKSYTILVVLPDNDDLQEFEELINHKDFTTRTQETAQTKGKQELLLTVKTTTFAMF